MDDKKKPNPRSSGGRTPQPPAGARDGSDNSSSKPPSQSRARASIPTATVAVPGSSALTSPTATGITGARSNAAPRQPKATNSNANNNNNNSSPRAIPSTRTPTHNEPATDEDDAMNRFQEPPKDEWLRQSEVMLAVLAKQVHDAAKRTLKHQNRCSTMKDSIVGKEDRMDTLQGTYATINRALVELELISSGDLDSDALEEMYNSIPSDERSDSALVHAADEVA